MPNIGKIDLLLMLMALSGIGIVDMANRWKNGKAYRELKRLKNPSRITAKILDECEQFLKPLWWHWCLLLVFLLSLLGLLIDTH